MALTLRELLDKQRAEREAKERGENNPSTISQPKFEGVSAQSPSPAPQIAPAIAPSPSSSPPKRSLFSSLTGASHADQSTQTPNSQAQVGAEIIAQSGNGVALPSGTASIPIPTFTGDETETLRKNLAFLAANLDEKEILGQVLRSTVSQIQAHPELNAVLVDSDFDLIVAAARRSMKYAARKKEDKTDARGKKQQDKAELDKWLKDQGIDL